MDLNGAYPIYDLANDHFQHAEIITADGEKIKGQFVRFKVVEDKLECLYPAEKFCFLPEENKMEFWGHYRLKNGEFDKFPPYLLKLGLNDIIEIKIHPALISK